MFYLTKHKNAKNIVLDKKSLFLALQIVSIKLYPNSQGCFYAALPILLVHARWYSTYLSFISLFYLVEMEYQR
jgi:hypothetical protein